MVHDISRNGHSYDNNDYLLCHNHTNNLPMLNTKNANTQANAVL